VERFRKTIIGAEAAKNTRYWRHYYWRQIFGGEGARTTFFGGLAAKNRRHKRPVFL